MRLTLALALSLALALVACDRPPTEPAASPNFAAATTLTVTTLGEWQNAVTNARRGATILVAGTIEIPGGEERLLDVPSVTIDAATPGSGLRGALNGSGDPPECLVCLGGDADRTTVKNLTLDGVTSSTPLQAAVGAAAAPLKNVTFKDNHVHCDDPCAVHVFFANAPNAVFVDNTLTGQPTFSAIQIQTASDGAVVKDNWVENGGPNGGIRIRVTEGSIVVDNTIASGPRWGILTNPGGGGLFRDNRILEVRDGVSPSCVDQSVGSKTAGTANTWVDNEAPVPSSPVGICGPTT